MTLETLKIEFLADTAPLEGSLGGLTRALDGVTSALDGAAGAAQPAGRQLAAGFARGIDAGSGSVGAAVRRMVNQATSGIRSLLGIHSPSKVAEGFGGYFGEGFANGISGSLGGVERASAALAGAAAGGLGAALPEEARAVSPAASGQAAQVLNLTVPLTVDGMKLGEASIRGINAVTRSAGRVLLEL